MSSTRRLSVTRGHIAPMACAEAIPHDAIRRVDEIFASYFAGQVRSCATARCHNPIASYRTGATGPGWVGKRAPAPCTTASDHD